MSDNWLTYGKKNSEYFEVHLVDHRNHGSSFHSDEMNYTVMTEDLKRYIDHYNLSDILLMGHSMGGKVSMNFACMYPELISKLIVIDICPKKYKINFTDLFNAIHDMPLEDISSRKSAEEFMEKRISNYGIRQFILKGLYRGDDDLLAWRFNSKVLEREIVEIGKELPSSFSFEKETLFLSGEKSDYIVDADSEIIKHHFPNSKIVEIKNAGHWVQSDNPEDFSQQTDLFLRG
ncbi:alpha/beta hydrolase [Ichthyobacterium seriolicida]|uniref:Alpha/beta hydrolase n=2 Tax=Ichthyobacterium seriolicida TaxID=242600 RepID=A0A1J1DZ57_9FLAO|nr:alpha/beta hydrolase [Ichthyobacterium seriolicida]